MELRRVRMRLVAPFRSSEGVQHERDVLLVHVLSADGEGWGECAALPEPTYTAEYTDGAADVLRRHLVPRLLAGADVDALDEVQGHPMAKAALRTAVLDAELRAAGTSLAQHLGAVRTRVPAGVAVGIPESRDAAELVRTVSGHVERGYHRVKLKIEPGWDVEPVAAVRGAHPDLPLWVDANGAYARDPHALAALDPFALDCIEQPLAVDDLVGHARLAVSMATPVALDESIPSSAAAQTAFAVGACGLVSVKPGRVGGLHEAKRIHDLGHPAWVGGMLETGIGRAAALALAALPGFTLAGELSASDRYYAEDLTEPFVLGPDGCLAVPDGPGIGVVPDPSALARRTVHLETLDRG